MHAERPSQRDCVSVASVSSTLLRLGDVPQEEKPLLAKWWIRSVASRLAFSHALPPVVPQAHLTNVRFAQYVLRRKRAPTRVATNYAAVSLCTRHGLAALVGPRTWASHDADRADLYAAW